MTNKHTKEEAEIIERLKKNEKPFDFLSQQEQMILNIIEYPHRQIYKRGWYADTSAFTNGDITYRIALDFVPDVEEAAPEYKTTKCRPFPFCNWECGCECPSDSDTVLKVCDVVGTKKHNWQFDGFIYGEVGGEGDYRGKRKQYMFYAPRQYRLAPCIVNDNGEIEYPVAVRWKKGGAV